MKLKFTTRMDDDTGYVVYAMDENGRFVDTYMLPHGFISDVPYNEALEAVRRYDFFTPPEHCVKWLVLWISYDEDGVFKALKRAGIVAVNKEGQRS